MTRDQSQDTDQGIDVTRILDMAFILYNRNRDIVSDDNKVHAIKMELQKLYPEYQWSAIVLAHGVKPSVAYDRCITITISCKYSVGLFGYKCDWK